jgi:hypothetical protein
VARSRALVGSVVGDGRFWYVDGNGSLPSAVKRTGIASTAAGPAPEPGPVWGDGLYAPMLRRVTRGRLGPGDFVDEMHTTPVPSGPTKERGNARRAVPRLRATERDARREVKPAGPDGKLVNPGVPASRPVAGYRPVPGENVARCSRPACGGPGPIVGGSRHRPSGVLCARRPSPATGDGGRRAGPRTAGANRSPTESEPHRRHGSG